MWDNAALLRSIANTLMVCSVLAMLYGAAHYVVHLPGWFPLRNVQLDAAPQRVIAQEVLAVARDEVRGNFFTVDIEQLRQSLEKLPWVRSVTIRREFPDRLAVQLEEHQALARWNGTALVNTYGEIFSAEAGQVLPDFIGQAGDSFEVAQRYAEFSRRLATLDLQVTRIALSPRHAWQLRLSNGMVLELGREAMQQRLARFVAAYPHSLAGLAGLVRYVDMRYRNGFAVGGMVRG
jgi:cell division protein FtsQ